MFILFSVAALVIYFLYFLVFGTLFFLGYVGWYENQNEYDFFGYPIDTTEQVDEPAAEQASETTYVVESIEVSDGDTSNN